MNHTSISDVLKDLLGLHLYSWRRLLILFFLLYLYLLSFGSLNDFRLLLFHFDNFGMSWCASFWLHFWGGGHLNLFAALNYGWRRSPTSSCWTFSWGTCLLLHLNCLCWWLNYLRLWLLCHWLGLFSSRCPLNGLLFDLNNFFLDLFGGRLWCTFTLPGCGHFYLDW